MAITFITSANAKDKRTAPKPEESSPISSDFVVFLPD